jgi:micrococcal nuclease
MRPPPDRPRRPTAGRDRPQAPPRSPRGANVFDFRDELRRQQRARRRGTLRLAATALGGAVLLGLAIVTTPMVWNSVAAAAASAPRFAVCGTIRRTCVVDGDTFWLDGEKIRIADIDTPEISEPQCASEYRRGLEARDRLVVLLNQGPVELAPIGSRDEDGYGRKLRVVTRGGASLGDQLVGEGLARTWTGRRQPWC